MSETGLRVTEETLGVKAANTEPALVMRQPGLAGLGSGLPTLPFPSGLQAAEAVCDVQRAAGQREGQVRAVGAATPRENLHDSSGTC